MFANLRQGSQLYIIHKSTPTPFVEVGSIESTSNVLMGYYPSMPNMPINISVRIGDKTTPYQNLPPNADVAEATNSTTGETVCIVCSKDALNLELQAMKQESIDHINAVPFHEQRKKSIEALIIQLNPEAREKAQREQEMAEMRNQISQMADMQSQIKQMSQTIVQLTNQLKEVGTSSTSNKRKEN